MTAKAMAQYVACTLMSAKMMQDACKQKMRGGFTVASVFTHQSRCKASNNQDLARNDTNKVPSDNISYQSLYAGQQLLEVLCKCDLQRYPSAQA